jgi:hypothetical protein
MIVSSITILACYALRPYVSYEDEFAVLVNATNVISYTLTIGLPVFLASSITFGTSNARRHILSLLKSGKSSTEVFLRCMVEAYALIVMFSVSITLALFIEPQLSRVMFYAPTGTGFLIYLLPVLIPTLVVSLLLATIGAFLVVVTDDIIVSTSIGCILSIGLAAAVGWSPDALWQSLTRGIAMLSPSNIVRIFAGLLSGYDPPHGRTLATYFGFEATAVSVLVSLVLFGVIVFICAIASIKILQRTTSFWSTLQEIRSEIWETESEHRGKHLKIKRELKIRKILLVSLVIILLLGVAFGTASYKSMVLEETTITFYQSPGGGEEITLGEWYVFSCNVQPPRYGQWNYLRYDCSVVDWGSSPVELSYYCSVLNMSSSEFLLLNETIRESLCYYRNVTRGNWGGFGSAWNLEQDSGFYTCVLKVFATENTSSSGFIHCSIYIRQSPW